MRSSLQALQDHLHKLPHGRIGEQDEGELSTLLAEAWDSLKGSTDGGMQSSKLDGRLESIQWNPPHLEFTIERHGAIVVGGSTRGELQRWRVDPERGTADLIHRGVRQIRASQARLDVDPLADTVASAIRAGADDPRLKWSADRTSVRVQIGVVIPDAGPKQTIGNRRKRFRAALDQRLAAAGWKVVKANTYRRA